MNGETRWRAAFHPVKEHRERHRFAPFGRPVMAIKPTGIEFEITGRGKTRQFQSFAVQFRAFASRRNRPVVQEIESAAQLLAKDVHSLREGAVRRFADVQEQLEICEELVTQTVPQPLLDRCDFVGCGSFRRSRRG